MPTRNYEIALWLESDRMAFMLDTLTSPLVDREIDIIRNEGRQRNGEVWLPIVSTGEIFPGDHPYHRAGSAEDLGHVGLRDLQYFFQTRYRPDNATLALVGDFDSRDAERQVRRYFSPILNVGQPIKRRPAPLPELKGRRSELQAGLLSRSVVLAWAIPADRRRRMALELVAECLVKPGSFLRETLDGSPLGGLTVEARSLNMDGGALFTLDAVFLNRTDPGRVLATLDIELDSLRASPAANCDLKSLADARARRQLDTGDDSAMAGHLAEGDPTPAETVALLSTLSTRDLEDAVAALSRDDQFSIEVW